MNEVKGERKEKGEHELSIPPMHSPRAGVLYFGVETPAGDVKYSCLNLEFLTIGIHVEPPMEDNPSETITIGTEGSESMMARINQQLQAPVLPEKLDYTKLLAVRNDCISFQKGKAIPRHPLTEDMLRKYDDMKHSILLPAHLLDIAKRRFLTHWEITDDFLDGYEDRALIKSLFDVNDMLKIQLIEIVLDWQISLVANLDEDDIKKLETSYPRIRVGGVVYPINVGWIFPIFSCPWGFFDLLLCLLTRIVLLDLVSVLMSRDEGSSFLKDKSTHGGMRYIVDAITRLADDMFLFQLYDQEIFSLEMWIFNRFRIIITGKGLLEELYYPEM